MKSVLKAAMAATLGLCAVAPAQAAPLPTWYGNYVWEEALGRVGGSAPSESVAAFVTYRLSIGPGAGPTGCRLTADGYQTHERIACTATPQREAVVIKFYSGNGRGARYTNGTPLFSMTRSGRAISTQLRAMTDSNGRARRGVLFQRVR